MVSYDFVFVESPGQPALRITSFGITEVSLAWSKTGTNPVFSWELEIKRGELEEWESLRSSLSESENAVIIDALSPNTTYWFRVAASNSFGFSPFSTIVRVTTEPIGLSSSIDIV